MHPLRWPTTSSSRPTDPRPDFKGPEFKLSRWILEGTLCWCLPCVVSHAACVGRPDLRTHLREKPTAQAHADLGDWFAKQKNYECAAQSFSLAAKLQPDSLPFNYLWGLSLYSADRAVESLVPLQKAEQLDAGDIRPHLALGGSLDRLKRTPEAVEEWRRALAIDADSATALDALSQDLLEQRDFTGVVNLLDRPGLGTQRTALQSLNLGIAFASSARLDDSVRVLREGFNTAPDSLPIANELAIVLLLMGRPEDAYGVFDLALRSHPDDLPTKVLYLRSLVSSQSDKAPTYAKTLLEKYPKQWEILYLNGILASNDGDYERARTLVSQSVELHPDSTESQQLLGSTLARLGDDQGARIHLEKAIAARDDQPEVHYELAKVLQKLGEPQAAKEQLLRYQKLKSAQSEKSQAAGKAEVADQELANGNPAKAIALYREALASDPDEPLLQYKLAKALDKTNDVAGEKAALKRAIDLNPGLPEAQNQMGYLFARNGDVAQAKNYFRAAIKASPSYVAAWINLAATLASESKWDDARKAVDRALEIEPDNAQARQLSQAITSAHPGP